RAARPDRGPSPSLSPSSQPLLLAGLAHAGNATSARRPVQGPAVYRLAAISSTEIALIAADTDFKESATIARGVLWVRRDRCPHRDHRRDLRREDLDDVLNITGEPRGCCADLGACVQAVVMSNADVDEGGVPAVDDKNAKDLALDDLFDAGSADRILLVFV